MNQAESNEPRPWLRTSVRLLWMGCCVGLLTLVTLVGSRYLANRRLMQLAKPANSQSVDPVLGWQRWLAIDLERWIGIDNELALSFRPMLLRVQANEVPDSKIVAILEASTGMSEIYIHNRNLPDGCLRIIEARHRPQILEFRKPVIETADALLLSKMKTLKHVNLGQFERQPRSNDWSWLPQLPALENLEVTLWAATEADVEALARCPALQNASLSGEDLTDNVIDRLCDAPALHWLDLEGRRIQLHFPDGRNLPSVLESLDLRCPTIDDHSLVVLAGCQHLNRVSFYGGQVTAEGLKSLAQLPALRQLWLADLTQLTDEGLKELAQSRSLQEVHVTDCSVTSQALIHLNEIPNWTELRFDQVTFRRQLGAPKLMLTPENVVEALERQRESERMQNEVINGPIRTPGGR